MNGENVKNSEEERHEIKSEDDPGRVEAVATNGNWNESEYHSSQERYDCYNVHYIPNVLDVIVQSLSYVMLRIDYNLTYLLSDQRGNPCDEYYFCYSDFGVKISE